MISIKKCLQKRGKIMEVDYTSCNNKKLKDNKCSYFTFRIANNEVLCVCKKEKMICAPVQNFINKFLHQSKNRL